MTRYDIGEVTKFGHAETERIMTKLAELYDSFFKSVGAVSEVHEDTWSHLCSFTAKATDSRAKIVVRPINYRPHWSYPSAERHEYSAKILEILVFGEGAKYAMMKRVPLGSFTMDVLIDKFALCATEFATLTKILRDKNTTDVVNTGLNEALMKKMSFVEREADPSKYDYGEHPRCGPTYIQGRLRNGIEIRIGISRAPHPEGSFSMSINTNGGLTEDVVLEIIQKMSDAKYGARVR
jgi:hypothetical protein